MIVPLHTPLGVQLLNPCCMRLTDTPVYLGEVRPSKSPAFRTFRSAQHGFRAVIEDLRCYQSRDGIKSVGAAIARWAPPSDNNPTDRYAENVASECNVETDEPVDFNTILLPMLRGMHRQECGSIYYGDEVIRAAIDMADEVD